MKGFLQCTAFFLVLFVSACGDSISDTYGSLVLLIVLIVALIIARVLIWISNQIIKSAPVSVKTRAQREPYTNILPVKNERVKGGLEMGLEILNHVHIGRENAVTRQELVNRTGKDNRTVREMIQEARLAGYPIMSSSTSSGYWLVESVEEAEQYIRENRSRIKKLTECNKKVMKLFNGRTA